MSRFHSTIALGSGWVRLFDGAVIVAAGLIALAVRSHHQALSPLPEDLRSYYSLLAASYPLYLLIGEAYGVRMVGTRFVGSGLTRALSTWLTVLGLLLSWLFITKASEDYSRIWLLLWAGFGALLIALSRLILWGILLSHPARAHQAKSVALLGSGDMAERLERRIGQENSGFRLQHRLTEIDPQKMERLLKNPLDEIWLSIPIHQLNQLELLMKPLEMSSATLRLCPDWTTFRLINHGNSEILGVPMIDLSVTPITGNRAILKTLEDRMLSTLILLAIAPLLLLIAIGVKLTSKGPIFFRQERVSLSGRRFTMLKFRSMEEAPLETQTTWGKAKEKRTTPFGRFLRKTSLDELPQFINVLKGDMSIVGPRPELPQFVERFREEIPGYMQKHLVKAGITGWAQVNGWRGDTDLKARIEHDLYYIENWSIGFDLKIILMTFIKGLTHPNAY